MAGFFGLCWILSGCLGGAPTVTLKEDIVDVLANDVSVDTSVDETLEVGNEQVCQPVCDGRNCGDDDQCGGKCKVDAGCDDGNPCTLDSCGDDFACAHDAQDGTCDDGDACTVGDACKEGKCEAGEDPLDCDDGNPCTDDSCDPAAGCLSRPRSREFPERCPSPWGAPMPAQSPRPEMSSAGGSGTSASLAMVRTLPTSTPLPRR